MGEEAGDEGSSPTILPLPPLPPSWGKGPGDEGLSPVKNMTTNTPYTRIDYPQHAELANDLLMSSFQKLVLTTTVASGAWVLILALSRAGAISLEILPIGAAIALMYGLVTPLISKNLKLAQIAWLILLAFNITLAWFQFRSSEVAYLYALLPLMAVAMLGWRAALLAGLLVLAGLFLVYFQLGAAQISLFQIGMIGFGEVLAGFIGWSAMSPLMTMLDWTSYSYKMAQENLEEARNQRIELKQVQMDLVLANKELARLTASLRIMTHRAEESRRVKEEFVANVSHELRTPLNMIIGYTNLIMKSPTAYGKKLPARLLADISSIQRNSQHLVDLINDVLDLSQVDAQRMALTRSWTSIHEIIKSAVIAVQPLFITKGLYLTTELPEQDILVYCDSTRIREVILNLLSNAGRFTDLGGVLVKAWRVDENLLVCVQDTGPGISPEDQQRIFEPFQQLDPLLHHRTGGSGLGLTISKRFVEMHHGKMWLASALGHGTTFYFQVPIHGLSEEDETRRKSTSTLPVSRWFSPYLEYTPRRHPSKAPRPEFTPRFVLVEKDGALQHLFDRYLDGVEVLAVPSLSEALASLDHAPAQAIVVNRPLGQSPSAFPDPFSTPESFRHPLFNQTPVLSCWVPGREEAARRLGVTHYLLKPVYQETLLVVLDEIGRTEMNVLLVDDDPETLQLFARILSVTRPGFHVIRASTGQEALMLMRTRAPDIVLLDLTMPGMSGLDVLKEKGNDPTINTIPVIVVSSTDPSPGPIISNLFSVYRSNGFSVKEFLDCLLMVSDSLNSDPQKFHGNPLLHPEPPKTDPESPV